MSSTTYSIFYPTKKKIVDCFIFYNELDLLNYRLNMLYDTVDYFIIVESTHTFTGKPKSMFFIENYSIFEKFKSKIIHIIVDDFPYVYPNIDTKKNEQWSNEHYQRNAIKRGLDKLELNDIDVILIADVDEIPDPITLTKIKNGEIYIKLNSLKMDFYYYNLNAKVNDSWTHPKMITYKEYTMLNKTCEQIRHTVSPSIERGGWHLSYFGNGEFIKNKIENFSHQEFNDPKYTDTTKIEERIANSQDVFDRRNHINTISKIPVKENPYLPPEYDKYLKNFISM